MESLNNLKNKPMGTCGQRWNYRLEKSGWGWVWQSALGEREIYRC